jgi:hypothetical protein
MTVRNLKIGMAATAVVAVLVGSAIAIASGVDIRPEKDTALITNIGPVTLKAGGVTVSCEFAQTTGTIPSPLASAMELYRTPFSKCKTSGEGTTTEYHEGKRWELIANSATSASLNVGSSSFFEINGRCRLMLEPPSLVSGTWATGSKHASLAQPASTLTVAGATLEGGIEDEKAGEGCPVLEEGGTKEGSKTKTTITMSGTFVVNDASHLNEPVELK